MDTNRIKRFATEARNILKAGIAAKIITLGFDKKGQVAEEHRPQLMQGGSLWNGQLQTEGFYYQWMSLYNRIQQKGINEVYEEAAYTWFNRLCAIRILQKNQLCAPVLDYADAARTPFIVDEARQGRIPQMKEDARRRLMELMDDDTKVTEQFAVLITAWCHDNPIIYQCFGGMSDYTELLLPNNILAEGGFVDMLNHTEFITDDEFQSPELIGWLYQFYISERKDEVFAKKGKFEADEIPAATQIFTPNWIVKYMVQNTVGRIYLDNNPYERQLQKKWQYLVEPTEKTPAESILKYDELTDLKVADLACGSGHILNECFDLLYDLYITEGYGRGEAIENIFKHNLTGVDIDSRAQQLASFALILKACQKDASFADAHCLPHVLTMPQPWDKENNDWPRESLPHFFLGQENKTHVDELIACFDLMQDADSLGSVMKFELSDSTRLLIKQTIEYWHNQEFVPEAILTRIPAFELILALTEKYHALVMNPPYMGGGNMNARLSKYVKKEYPSSKNDLMTVFMEVCMEHLYEKGKYGMINLPSWLFLSSFEALRKDLISNYHIDSLLHMGRGIFGIDWGSTTFVITNVKTKSKGVYFKLHERNFQHIYFTHIGQLFLQVLNNHELKYDFTAYRDEDVTNIELFNFKHSENGIKLYFEADQSDFEKIPGSPIGYWVSPNILKIFTSNLALSAVASPCVGLQTADNARFLRLWSEVSRSRIGFGFENAASAARSGLKWFPYNKGGSARKWYGNQTHIINWENDGEEIKTFKGAVIRNPDYYFNPSISWGLIASTYTSFRDYPAGFIYDVAGMSLFPYNENTKYAILGWLNTNLFCNIIKIINPTINMQCGDVAKAPYISINGIENSVKQNISISRQDWDAHETSWDFETNPLLAVDENTYIDNINHEIEQHEKETGEHICMEPAAPQLGSLQWRMEQYKKKWERMFYQLHENEEELNRQFIEIYGLQDELTPDVPLSEITILQAGEISIEEE